MGKVTMTSYGGGDCIGGSAHGYLFCNTTRTHRALVDFGGRHVPFTPERKEDLLPEYAAHIGKGEIDSIYVTHSHFDHMAMLPWISSRNPNAPIFMRAAACDFIRLGLEESLRSMRRWPVAERLFTRKDVSGMLARVHIVEPFRRVYLGGGLTARVLPAQHIAGAASFIFEYEGRRYYHTGDVSCNTESLLEHVPIPRIKGDTTVHALIPDGTYAGERHIPHEKAVHILEDTVARTRARGGILICPVLKQYKAQALWHLLTTKIGISEKHIWFDGRLEDAFRLYARYTEMKMPPLGQFMHGRHDRYDFFAEKGFRVLLASGGMLPQGSPGYHAVRLGIEDPQNTIIKTAYAEPCSHMHGIFHAVMEGESKKVELGGEEYEVRAEVVSVPCLQSHADEVALQSLRERVRDGRVAFVHGDSKRLTDYVAKEENPDVVVGTNGVEVELT